MITVDQIPVQSSNFLTREIGDETIFIDQKGDKLHTIDEIGTFIWKNINGKNSILKIIDKICEEYEVERNVAQKDILEYIKKLFSNNIITFKNH